MFCPKCGSILMPKTDKRRRKVMGCSCGYVQKEGESIKLKEEVKKEKTLDVVEGEAEEKRLPVTEAECPKCGHKKAYYYTAQTRAADEPETKFLICMECGHRWRDYN